MAESTELSAGCNIKYRNERKEKFEPPFWFSYLPDILNQKWFSINISFVTSSKASHDYKVGYFEEKYFLDYLYLKQWCLLSFSQCYYCLKFRIVIHCLKTIYFKVSSILHHKNFDFALFHCIFSEHPYQRYWMLTSRGLTQRNVVLNMFW